MQRRKTRLVTAGKLQIGGESHISVQSMSNTDLMDLDKTLQQISMLSKAGCELVRVAVPDEEAAGQLKSIVQLSSIPVCADIHFNHKIALKAIDAGVSKIRINPGNIGSEEKVTAVVSAAKAHGIPIRIGVNSGSIEREFRLKYGRSAIALAESALKELAIFERNGFYDTVLSVKSSDVMDTVEANRYISSKVDYPLHLGVTEAGPPDIGVIRSSAALSVLLLEGIGDTIRISLTGDPVAEVMAGKELLRSLGLAGGLRLISCPTCGRSRGDVAGIVAEVRAGLSEASPSITVAVMGCEVNGPGEASGADFGIACGVENATIFAKGQVVARVPINEASGALLEIIAKASSGVN